MLRTQHQLRYILFGGGLLKRLSVPPLPPPLPNVLRNCDDSHSSGLRSDDMLKMSSVWNEMTFQF